MSRIVSSVRRTVLPTTTKDSGPLLQAPHCIVTYQIIVCLSTPIGLSGVEEEFNGRWQSQYLVSKIN